MMERKIKSSKALSKVIKTLRSKGRRIVFTNGCFDILHTGHVVYLKKARALGDVLVVGLNGDRSVRRIKGKGRPINRERDRANVLAALSFVDYVTIFDESTPTRVIRLLKPDVLVKGGDWKTRDIVGGDFVRRRGGKVVRVPFMKGYSTSVLAKKISRL
jgi:D-beta-D-heptose 7-phosphate kinase/D-beta-D-heptose 1-phosphate adenosyltransferase